MDANVLRAVLIGFVTFVAGELWLLLRAVSRLTKMLLHQDECLKEISAAVGEVKLDFSRSSPAFPESTEKTSATISSPAKMAPPPFQAEPPSSEGRDVISSPSESIGGEKRRSRRNGEATDQIRIGVLKTVGGRTENVVIGLLDGKWLDKKQFRVMTFEIKGEIARRQVYDIGERLGIRDRIQKSLVGFRNDDPIFLSLQCRLDSSRSITITTPIIGNEQELKEAIIPRVNLDYPQLKIRASEDAMPLSLEIVWP